MGSQRSSAAENFFLAAAIRLARLLGIADIFKGAICIESNEIRCLSNGKKGGAAAVVCPQTWVVTLSGMVGVSRQRGRVTAFPVFSFTPSADNDKKYWRRKNSTRLCCHR